MSSAACANESLSMCAISPSLRPYDGLTVIAASHAGGLLARATLRASRRRRRRRSRVCAPRRRPSAECRAARSARATGNRTRARARPGRTWIAIAVWPSLYVVNSCARDTGMVELRGMIFSVSPPIVSSPSDSGITSSSSQSSLRSRLPASLFACTAAPSATTSSGLRLVSGGWPKKAPTARRTCGMRVAPPTSTTPLMSLGRHLRVAQRALHRLHRLVDEVRGDLGEDRAS